MAYAIPTPATDGSDLPPGGVDYFFSAELVAAFQATKKTSCSSVNADCQRALQQAIQNKSVGLEVRGIIAAAAALVYYSAAVVALITAVLTFKPDTSHVHFEPEVLSQITSADVASGIAVATGTEAPFITIVQSAPVKPSPTPKYVTL